MDRVIAIIRIQTKELHSELSDLERFGDSGLHNIRFQIPKVKVLKRSIKGEQQFIDKPLLFNYGFIELPLEYAKNPTRLIELKARSRIILSFFFKTAKELKVEQDIFGKEGLSEYHPVIVKSISRKELDRLYEAAKTLNVYDNTDRFDVGSYIMLQGYPFEGMSARIKRKKTNGRIQVELMDNGMLVWLEPGNVYFSAYNDENNEPFKL